MPKVELEATSEVREATLDLAGAEAIADLTDAAVAAHAGGARELVFDLRTPGRPAVPILQAIEAVADALDALGPTLVRCLVSSERVAAHVRESLRATEQRSSRWRGGGAMVQLRTGDITAIAADAVVNASNTQLRLGSGVSGALRRACGPALQAEMSALAPIEPGGLAATSAHELMTTSRILHVATASGEVDVIRRALANILAYGSKHALGAVAVSALGMGTGGLSREACCAAFRDAISNHAASHPHTIIVVLWAAADYDAFAAGFATYARFARVGGGDGMRARFDGGGRARQRGTKTARRPGASGARAHPGAPSMPGCYRTRWLTARRFAWRDEWAPSEGPASGPSRKQLVLRRNLRRTELRSFDSPENGAPGPC